VYGSVLRECEAQGLLRQYSRNDISYKKNDGYKGNNCYKKNNYCQNGDSICGLQEMYEKQEMYKKQEKCKEHEAESWLALTDRGIDVSNYVFAKFL
jgi:hypothetical protein